MDNMLGAVLGIGLLLASIAAFPIGFALGGAWLPILFIVGVILLSAALPVPIYLLERFEGVRDR